MPQETYNFVYLDERINATQVQVVYRAMQR